MMSCSGQICSLVIIVSQFLPLLCSLVSSGGQQDVSKYSTNLRSQTSARGRQSTRQGEGESVFRAIWDVPNSCEDNYGIEIPLDDFGIEFNRNHDWRFGHVLTVFNRKFGRYPYVKITHGTRFVNGGIPQLGNITDHLEKAADDIARQIPDRHYKGLVMIDWEEWSPQWWGTEHRYRKYSIDNVRSRHPHWDNTTIKTVAKLEWTQSAKEFMESTLKLVKQMRPEALCGFYCFPKCFAKTSLYTNETACEEDNSKLNDQILWLFNASTIIYPSIYLKPENNVDFKDAVKVKLAETFRVMAESSNPKGVVMSYTRFNYSDSHYYFTLEDLNHTILTSAEFGTHGVVFWGDNFDDKTSQSCQELRDYVIEALGPTVVMAREGAESCSRRVCSGRGRCVGEIMTCEKGKHLQNETIKEEGKQPKGTGCSCRCFVGWGGEDCSILTKY